MELVKMIILSSALAPMGLPDSMLAAVMTQVSFPQAAAAAEHAVKEEIGDLKSTVGAVRHALDSADPLQR